MTQAQQFIVFVIVVALGFKFVPEVTWAVLALGLLAYYLENRPKWNKERAKQKQLKDDAPLRDEFWAKHQAIRDKYDPKHEWNEATSLPRGYVEEMAKLNEEYREVMDRWHNQ